MEQYWQASNNETSDNNRPYSGNKTQSPISWTGSAGGIKPEVSAPERPLADRKHPLPTRHEPCGEIHERVSIKLYTLRASSLVNRVPLLMVIRVCFGFLLLLYVRTYLWTSSTLGSWPDCRGQYCMSLQNVSDVWRYFIPNIKRRQILHYLGKNDT